MDLSSADPIFGKTPLAGDLAQSLTRSREKPYSGGTAPDSHRIPHQFPVRATDFQLGAAFFFTTRQLYSYPSQRSRNP